MEKEKLSEQHMAALAEYGLATDVSDISLFRYKSDEFILQQGYPCPYILILLEGRMKVFNTVLSGRTLLSCYYATSGILGEVEFASDAHAAASSVQAVTDVSCIAIPIARYKNELKGNITFMNAVSAALAQKLFLSSRNSAAAILHPLDARLCAYIAMTNTGGCFREKLTELAEILGTSYRHLLRTLNGLCLRGVLEKTPQGYLIRDEAELGRISGDCYLK
jgi:CRP/FNR family putative post-exponential-phase nitrogen-starvation transcriptional regulator